MDKLQNSDYLVDRWNTGNISDEGYQEELMDAIAERAAILYKNKNNKDSLVKAGYDPNDTISKILMKTDLSNTNYDDPFNPIYDIMDEF